MKLSYRGVSYEQNPDPILDSKPPVADVKYRGVAYRQHEAAKAEALNAVLKYRGASYNAEPVVEKKSVDTATTPVSSIEQKARWLTTNYQRLIKNRQQAMLKRAAAEVGLVALS